MTILFFTQPAFSTTYYLDQSGGSDSNTGLTPEEAWVNFSKIRQVRPGPGDTILLKRGESWSGTKFYIDFQGTATDPIVIGAYGDPNNPLPIISSISEVVGSSDETNWVNDSANIWRLSLTATPGRLFVDGVEILRADSLINLGKTDGEGATGEWFWDSASNSLFLLSTLNPAIEFASIEGSREFETVQLAISEHLVFQELDIRGGWGASFGASGCHNLTIKNCIIGKFGNSGIRLIDFSTPGNPLYQTTRNITVTQNLIDSDFTFFYEGESERGCGDGIRMFWAVDSCKVYNNTFKNWAHNAIELLGNQANRSGVNQNAFYDNYITAPDIPYAHPLGMDGLLDKCRDNSFFRNLIEDCRTTAQVNGNNNWVHHNIIVGMRNSPNKINGTAYAFAMGVYGAGLVSQDNRFDYNLIIDTDEAAFQIRGFGFDTITRGHQIRNNIIYEVGQAPDDDRYAMGTGIELYDPDGTDVGPNIFQNNLFYNSLSDSNFVFVRDSNAHFSVDAFHALNGFEGNVITNNLFGDPLFTDLLNGNYRPQAGSPAIDAGLDAGLAVDYDQMSREVGSAPDIGPLETNYPPPPTCVSVSVSIPTDTNLVLEPAEIILADTLAAYDSLSIEGGLVPDGDSLIILAGRSISLKPGFTAAFGSSLTAKVDSLCDNQTPLVRLQILNPAMSNPPANSFSIQVRPNPVSDVLCIQLESFTASPVDVVLYNASGQLVRTLLAQANLEGGTFHLTSNISALRSGLYFLVGWQGKERIVKRVLVVD